jgi:hypothetical protein
MKKNAIAFSLALTALLASLGMERAIAQEAEHDHQHQAASAGSLEKKAKPATTKAAAKPNKAAPGGMMTDMEAMCDMHRQMMSSGSPADREAMIDKEMKGMSAEQKQQHMKMMDEKCK